MDSALTKKKSIASDISEKGSNASGKQSVASAKAGLMFKCFDSIYGAQRILSNIKDRTSVNGGSVNEGMSVGGGLGGDQLSKYSTTEPLRPMNLDNTFYKSGFRPDNNQRDSTKPFDGQVIQEETENQLDDSKIVGADEQKTSTDGSISPQRKKDAKQKTKINSTSRRGGGGSEKKQQATFLGSFMKLFNYQ